MKFKNSSNGWITRSLFYEQKAFYPEIEPIYTLKKHDLQVNGKTYPSLHRLYVEATDTTEYTFANTHLGGWDHWNALTECNFFEPYLEAMRDELQVKLKAQSLQAIIAISQDPMAKGHLEANKFLIKEGIIDKPTRGRPKKIKDPKKHYSEIKEEERRIKEDLKRMGLN